MKTPDRRGGKYAGVDAPDGAKAAARALFESIPANTIAKVADELKIPAGTIRRWKALDTAAGAPWRPAPLRTPSLIGRAGEIANAHSMRLAELGPAADDEHARVEAEVATANEVAAEMRARIITRHRSEWAGPRKIAYEAMQERSVEKARLAKIAAETLEIVQRSEMRSWGLDPAALSADAQGKVVVIDRSGDRPLPDGEGA